ncbi:MAG TPA: chemotaxis protein CheX [Jatrophihabitans sp.]|nr:chemotaxis protein CheX [Jatrophihabitans sp.]
MSALTDVPAAGDICQLVDEVWSTFLGAPSGPYQVAAVSELPGPVLSCQVGISGSWNGTLTLSLTAAGALEAAAAMFGLVPDELAPSDLEDAVGELGNIVAGNIKSCLPEPSALSLPAVSRDPQPPAGQPRLELTLAWDAHLLQITLTETTPALKVGA